jgi:hypothetical protein
MKKLFGIVAKSIYLFEYNIIKTYLSCVKPTTRYFGKTNQNNMYHLFNVVCNINCMVNIIKQLHKQLEEYLILCSSVGIIT